MGHHGGNNCQDLGQQVPLFGFFNANSSSVNVCLFIVSSALTWKTLWDYFFRFNAMSIFVQDSSYKPFILDHFFTFFFLELLRNSSKGIFSRTFL